MHMHNSLPYSLMAAATTKQTSDVAVVAVPLPEQGHLNQMLQLSSIISSHALPVHYVGSAVHNRQAKTRVNSLSPKSVAGIIFHDIPIPPFLSPPPNPNSINKFPTQLQPAFRAMENLRRPVTDLLQKLSQEFRRVVVVYDPWMSFAVLDAAEIHNAETYAFVSISAFSAIYFICGSLGVPFPLPHPKELPPFEGLISDEANETLIRQRQHQLSSLKSSGSIYNTSRLMEAPYLGILEKNGGKPVWGIGPMLPTNSRHENAHRHECLEWLDKQELKSVIYVSFGSTVSLSDEQINEIARGLEQSKVKFLWVLRDADKGDVFEGEVRRVELPEGFEGGDEGMVVRDWAPQPQILAHPSIGGFMSHCGWNSSVECITTGVAMAAWPMHSDQPSNAALVADILKTGVVVREWTERAEVVKASRVESVVRRLMASEEGGELRKRAEELGATVRGATEPGGASRVEMESLIAHFTR